MSYSFYLYTDECSHQKKGIDPFLSLLASIPITSPIQNPVSTPHIIIFPSSNSFQQFGLNRRIEPILRLAEAPSRSLFPFCFFLNIAQMF
jgi:hypothetical protein